MLRRPSGAAPPLAPRPQPSAFPSTPILNQQIEDEPEVIREWREKQAEIKQRDEVSKPKHQETISMTEASIDQFYEEYAAKKERSMLENKYILSCHLAEWIADANVDRDQEADYIENLQSSLTTSNHCTTG
ncbi:hypothetical protein OG21DRAFT_1428374 [Imleria badia]|nr:hypothetical protein OG21DRAFT_1428374 [Imleria badia]